MYELSREIRTRIYDMADREVDYEVVEEGLPYEYRWLVFDRVYSNLLNELKAIL